VGGHADDGRCRTSDTPRPDAKAEVIAFGSVATNLVPGDANGVHDVFGRVRPER
jgi:hypothetical protein